MKRRSIVIAAILAAGLLAGCRQEEQGHSYVFDKGQYTGKADSQLTSAQLAALQSRAALQGTANVSGGAARRPVEERPAPVPNAALSKRLQEQAGPDTGKDGSK